MTPKPTPRQVLSLLPGEYYHPEAEYEEKYYDSAKKRLWRRGHRVNWKSHGIWEEYYANGTLWGRYHYLHGTPHGLWEGYHKDGTLHCRHHYLHMEKHGAWEWYRKDGTLEKLKCFYEGNRIPFFIESLLGISILDI